MDGDDRALVCPLGTVLRGKYRLDRVLGIGGMAVVQRGHTSQPEAVRNQDAACGAVFAAGRVRPLPPRRICGQYGRSPWRRGRSRRRHIGERSRVSCHGAARWRLRRAHLGEKRSRVPVGPALAIVHQLMDILAAAHAKSMVHRDIKPANLFITRDGQLKVLDFGIARVRDAASSAQHATGTGLVLGTPAFMAPEQALAKSQEIDARTDVWAAGATLFTLLTGRNVHEGDNGQQVLIRAATSPAPLLASVDPDAPRSVTELVDRALAFDRSQRWSSAEVMRDVARTAYQSICGKIAWQTALLALLGEGEPRIGPGQFSESFVPWPTPPLPIDLNSPNQAIEALEEVPSSRRGMEGAGRRGVGTSAPTLDYANGHGGLPMAGRGTPMVHPTIGSGEPLLSLSPPKGGSRHRSGALRCRHGIRRSWGRYHSPRASLRLRSQGESGPARIAGLPSCGRALLQLLLHPAPCPRPR